MNTRINLKFDHLTLQGALIAPVIKKAIMKTLEQEGVNVGCEINVLLTNDRGIQDINKACRNIDRPTDVLSFPMFTLTPGELPEQWHAYIDPDTQLCPLGDMAMSVERAAAQAKEFGHSVRREVGYLTIHSMLHLLGYDHLDEGEQKKMMRKREEEIASTIYGLQR